MNGRGTLLRRSCSQVSSKPAPPTRRTPSTVSCEDSEAGQSNTTTPRGSMEFLPPPPPHLLHSDEEPDSGGAQEAVVTRRGPSVADSIKESLDNDVYIPMYTKHQMEAPGNQHAAFFNRQFWTTFKLYKNVLSWAVISKQYLKDSSI